MLQNFSFYYTLIISAGSIWFAW